MARRPLLARQIEQVKGGCALQPGEQRCAVKEIMLDLGARDEPPAGLDELILSRLDLGRPELAVCGHLRAGRPRRHRRWPGASLAGPSAHNRERRRCSRHDAKKICLIEPYAFPAAASAAAIAAQLLEQAYRRLSDRVIRRAT